MDLKTLKGVSEKREREFNKLNIYTAEDLVKLYPRTFLDLTRVEPITCAYHNDVILTTCEVLSVEVNRYARRPFVKAMCQQGGVIFHAIWFNQPYVATKLQRAEYFFYGRVQNKYGMGASMVNPVFEKISQNNKLKGVIPVYPLAGALTQSVVQAAIKQALYKVNLQSVIPLPLQKKYELMPLAQAYFQLHMPNSQQEIQQASERIACEEYFVLLSAFKMIKGDKQEARAHRYTVTEGDVADFMGRFPFEFTGGQKTAVREIYDNLRSPHKMNRLIQGDVGSGKTAVALTAIYMAVKSGFQAAMLAPTEVLARQNAALIQKYFPDYAVGFLSGSTAAAEKRTVKKALALGEMQIVCGTHAVLQADVTFQNLALSVCDEQHRFGVAQRSSLADKGEGCDVLVMSATPIPRTLSLLFYGDLDITTIKDKPRSRQDISTSIIPRAKYNDMIAYVAREAKAGRQTYFVCPKIEGDDEGTVKSVTELYEELQAQMPSARVALLHGKMKDSQKNEIMQAFKDGQTDCLVSTTVIEVGVDVPNATTMIIYNAERFGLAQLHQLRGRVGRGEQKSYCFLLAGTDNEEARERLTVLKNSTDGFEIAENDLKMRGGGDFMGTKQSGHILSELKNLRFPVNTIFMAKAIADEALGGNFDITALRTLAMKKYNSLKDVVLN